ncbi:MAG: hypothetical protein EOP83_03630 [Verrucomicrobiaceae bacterium]|nr:MAG: hypothetical protein EOP83_03630 [Verrucomicrobiaceae bacterium]
MPSLTNAMSRAAVAPGGFVGKYRMKPRGKWFTLTDTKNVPIVYPTAQDASNAAESTGRAYRAYD